MRAMIQAISYALPETALSNAQLAEQYPEWPIEKIYEKTGIKNRYIAKSDEYSLDFAIKAAKKLFEEHDVHPNEIDFIILCTQTPKYLIPTGACILQQALNLPATTGAIDINQGCSGFVYSLIVAESLINNQRAKKVLLITADTYTKLIEPFDRSLKTLFGDGAAASLITASPTDQQGIQQIQFGTNGTGAEKLMAKNSGMQGLSSKQIYCPDLYMDGSGIFNFTLGTIPGVVDALLQKNNLCLNDIDLFIFHQANKYLLEHLRNKIGINSQNFFIHIEDIGNTVSSSIPIALCEALKSGKIKPGHKIMLVGFGVGLSWAACTINY